jgi:hypothetical protein
MCFIWFWLRYCHRHEMSRCTVLAFNFAYQPCPYCKRECIQVCVWNPMSRGLSNRTRTWLNCGCPHSRGLLSKQRTPLQTAPASPPICTVPQHNRGCLQLRRAYRDASSTFTYILASRTLTAGDPRLTVTRARPILIIH